MFESDQMVTSVWASMASWFTPTILFCFLNLMIATIYLASTFKNHHPPPGQLARAPSLLNRVKSINFPFSNPEHHYPFVPQTRHIEEPSSNSMSSRLQQHNSSSQLVRAPSLLERVKSINFSFYGQEHDNPHVPQPHFEEPTSGFSSFSLTREEHSSPSRLVRAPSLVERVRSFIKPDHHDPFQTQTHEPEQKPDWVSDDHLRRSKSSENRGVIPAKVSGKMKKSASQKVVATTRDEEIERRRPATVRAGKGKKVTASSGEDGEVDAKADDFINKFKQQLKLQRLDSLLRYKEMLGRGT